MNNDQPVNPYRTAVADQRGSPRPPRAGCHYGFWIAAYVTLPLMVLGVSLAFVPSGFGYSDPPLSWLGPIGGYLHHLSNLTGLVCCAVCLGKGSNRQRLIVLPAAAVHIWVIGDTVTSLLRPVFLS